MKAVNVIIAIIYAALLCGPAAVTAQNSLILSGDFMMGRSTMTGDEFDGIEVDPAGVFGSSLVIQYEQLVLGGSFLIGDYQWNYAELSPDLSRQTATRRSDFTYQLGYLMSPEIYLFAGAKQLRFHAEKDDFPFFDERRNLYRADYVFDYAGILLGGGIAAMMQFPESPLFLKWSAAYYTGDLELNFSENEETVEGYPVKHRTNLTDIFVGLGLRFDSGLGIVLGYKACFSGDKQGEERNHGLAVSLLYGLDI